MPCHACVPLAHAHIVHCIPGCCFGKVLLHAGLPYHHRSDSCILHVCVSPAPVPCRRIVRLREAAATGVVEEGDWLCGVCGNLNWHDRRECRK